MFLYFRCVSSLTVAIVWFGLWDVLCVSTSFGGFAYVAYLMHEPIDGG